LCSTPRSSILFCYMTRLPPSSPLFPYTTLFRSAHRVSRRASLPVRTRLRGGAGDGRPEEAEARRQAAGRADDLDLARRDRPLERSEEHTSELQSRENLVCRLLLEKKKI